MGYIWHRDTGEQPVGEIRIGSSSYMRRTGPGESNPVVDWGEYSAADCKALAGRLYSVYEVKDGWLRITQRGVGGTAGQWISAAAGTLKSYTPAASASPEKQLITIGPVTQGDADAILAVCKARGLDKQGLYSSHWNNDAHTLQTITIGPVTRGDADVIFLCCVGRKLTDAGLYRSQPV